MRSSKLRRLLPLLLLPFGLLPLEAPAASSRPNVLVILTDDQTLESVRVMDRTRELLADEGTTFSNAVVSYPMCCPSRATELTGQYAHNHKVLGNNPPEGGYGRLNPSNTLPVWLQEAGYETAHVGKYLNGYTGPEVPRGWKHWFGLSDPTTYRVYDYTVIDDGRAVHYGEAESDYQTDVLARKAEEILRGMIRSGHPFFLNVAPVYDEADVSDKPPHIRRLPRLGPAKKELILRTYRARLESLQAVDDLVGRLVNVLEETGQLDHTVIVFASDNGFFLGEHRITDGKLLPYEESIRVPLIVRGGGFPAGHTAKQLVANIDLAPTLVQLTGAKARRKMDGRSLLPLALDPSLGQDRSVLIEGVSKNPAKPSYDAIRTSRWLYVEYKTGARELYDLETDPLQLRSRHDAPALKAVRTDLARRLAKLRTCAGPSCRE